MIQFWCENMLFFIAKKIWPCIDTGFDNISCKCNKGLVLLAKGNFQPYPFCSLDFSFTWFSDIFKEILKFLGNFFLVVYYNFWNFLVAFWYFILFSRFSLYDAFWYLFHFLNFYYKMGLDLLYYSLFFSGSSLYSIFWHSNLSLVLLTIVPILVQLPTFLTLRLQWKLMSYT